LKKLSRLSAMVVSLLVIAAISCVCLVAQAQANALESQQRTDQFRAEMHEKALAHSRAQALTHLEEKPVEIPAVPDPGHYPPVKPYDAPPEIQYAPKEQSHDSMHYGNEANPKTVPPTDEPPKFMGSGLNADSGPGEFQETMPEHPPSVYAPPARGLQLWQQMVLYAMITIIIAIMVVGLIKVRERLQEDPDDI
jgi:hypothetical protein